jgi:hypothetical protein
LFLVREEYRAKPLFRDAAQRRQTQTICFFHKRLRSGRRGSRPKRIKMGRAPRAAKNLGPFYRIVWLFEVKGNCPAPEERRK